MMYINGDYDDDVTLTELIRKFLGDFRYKSPTELPESYLPKNGPFSRNFHRRQKRLAQGLDLFSTSSSSTCSEPSSSRKLTQKKKIDSKNKTRKKSDLSIKNYSDDESSLSTLTEAIDPGDQTAEIDKDSDLYNEDCCDNPRPIWGVSSYMVHLVNKKESLLRIACDLYAEHKWNSFLQLAHSLILNTRFPGYLLMKNFLLFLNAKPPLTESGFIQAKLFIHELLFMMEERFDTLLELIMYVVENRKYLLTSGKKFIEELRLKHERWSSLGPKRKYIPKSLDILRQTFQIYHEYLDYVEWKSLYANDPSTFASLVRIDKMKTNFLALISQVEHQELNMDIVPLIMLELYVDYENELPEALVMLQQYSTKFPDNLNGHVYLYEFLSKFNDLEYDLQVKIDCLKHIVRLCPDSKYTLRLVNGSNALTGLGPLERLELLCNFLDYDSNRQSQKAWKYLYQILNHISNDDQHLEILKKIQCYFLVKLRYWQRMHFCLDQLEMILPQLRIYHQNYRHSDSSSGLSSGEDFNDNFPNMYHLNDSHKLEFGLKHKLSSPIITRQIYHLYRCKAKFLDELNQERFGCLKDFPRLLEYKNFILNL